MPKVSVIVPIYGVEQYIEKCAISLFEQTMEDIEYIFIDDCTKDRSIDILKDIIERYPHRRSQTIIETMSHNTGQAYVRQKGVSIAKGEYIAFCDSDDWVEREMYEQMYEIGIKKGCQMVVCDYISSNGNDYSVHYGMASTSNRLDFIRDLISMKYAWSLCNKIIRRELFFSAIHQFPKSNNGEDLAIVLQIVYECPIIGYIHKSFYNYYQNPHSLTKQVSRQAYERRFYQFQDNLKIVLSYYSSKREYALLSSAFTALQFFGKAKLWPLLRIDKSYYSLWQKTAPRLFSKMLTCKYLRTNNKIKYILTCLKLYP